MFSKVKALALFSIFSVFAFSNEEKSYTTIHDLNPLQIKTPSLQDREIAKIRLANDLNVYLISDPNADKSAAALSVHAGQWSDSKAYPGIAHFLEHMLFMGTEKYPEERVFMQYVSDHGGMTNAFTAPDRTVYMFSINNDSFESALDQFAYFFKAPLFKTSGVERELLAVDQEHAKNIESDNKRTWMILKETGNPLHPNRSFSSGNAQTLGDIPRDALVKWFSENYSSHLMNLVIYSSLPIETLKEWAQEDFSKIQYIPQAKATEYQQLTSETQRGHIIYIKPVKELKELSLLWELPRHVNHDKDTHSAELIAHVIENGSDNSLTELLKREQLAEDLEAGVLKLSSENQLLCIDITLTPQGVQEIDHVLSRCFQTLGSLRRTGIPKYIFDEKKKMAETRFKYQSRSNAFNFVSTAAYELVTEALETYPYKSNIATEYSPESISEILNLMSPSSCVYILKAPPELTGVEPEKKERWCFGEYSVKPVASSYLESWENIKPNPLIGLPKTNPYIPTHLSLLPIELHQNPFPMPTPVKNDTNSLSYFWEDTMYAVPEISWNIGVKTPLITGSPRSMALTDLYLKCVQQNLSPLLNQASFAGIHGSLSLSNLSILLQVDGYSQKAPLFLETFLKQMKDTIPTAAQFDIYKESLIISYQNEQYAKPYMQAGEMLSNILYNDAPLSSDKAKALIPITYEEFLSFCSQLFSSAYVEAMFTGNMLSQEAEEIDDIIKTTLNYQPIPKSNLSEKQVLMLPKNSGPFYVQEQGKVMGNATILALELGPFSYDSRASSVVLGKAIKDNFFDTLRTKQQTGYITFSTAKCVEKQLLQYFLVQSSTHQPQELLSRFELFLENYVKDFSNQLSKERFEEIKNSIIEEINQPKPSLVEMNDMMYNIAFRYDGMFELHQKILESLEALTYEKVKQDAKTFFSRNNTRRLAVLFEGHLPMENLFKYQPITSVELKEIGAYISSK